MCWDLKGSNTVGKMHNVRWLVRKYRPLLVGLQETKRREVSVTTGRHFYGNETHKWMCLPSIGASGGLVLFLDSDRLKVIDEILKGKYSLSILCRLVGSEEIWVGSNMYGLCVALGDF